MGEVKVRWLDIQAPRSAEDTTAHRFSSHLVAHSPASKQPSSLSEARHSLVQPVLQQVAVIRRRSVVHINQGPQALQRRAYAHRLGRCCYGCLLRGHGLHSGGRHCHCALEPRPRAILQACVRARRRRARAAQCARRCNTGANSRTHDGNVERCSLGAPDADGCALLPRCCPFRHPAQPLSRTMEQACAAAGQVPSQQARAPARLCTAPRYDPRSSHTEPPSHRLTLFHFQARPLAGAVSAIPALVAPAVEQRRGKP